MCNECNLQMCDSRCPYSNVEEEQESCCECGNILEKGVINMNLKKEIEKIALFLQRVFTELGFNTKFEFKKRKLEEFNVFEYTTDYNNNFINYYTYFFEGRDFLVVNVKFGTVYEKLEVQKVFSIENIKQNIEFIKEIIINHYEKCVK